MSLKKLFFLSTVIFLIGQMDLFAQSVKVSLSGTIQDAKSGETLPFVVVNIKDLNLWTTSDINGKFSFKNVKKGEYTLTASCLGYKDYEMKINLSKNIEKYILKLEEQTLALKEVTVTATSGNKLNSSSSIKKAALEHVQASSIVDVMQLLPGSLTVNPNLNDISKLTIRDVTGKDATNAFGTAVIVDEEVKGRRLQELIDMQVEISHQSNLKDVGKVFEVLVEGVSKKKSDELFGRSSQNKVIVFPDNGAKVGELVQVRVTECTPATLIGEAIKN